MENHSVVKRALAGMTATALACIAGIAGFESLHADRPDCREALIAMAMAGSGMQSMPPEGYPMPGTPDMGSFPTDEAPTEVANQEPELPAETTSAPSTTKAPSYPYFRMLQAGDDLEDQIKKTNCDVLDELSHYYGSEKRKEYTERLLLNLVARLQTIPSGANSDLLVTENPLIRKIDFSYANGPGIKALLRFNRQSAKYEVSPGLDTISSVALEFRSEGKTTFAGMINGGDMITFATGPTDERPTNPGQTLPVTSTTVPMSADTLPSSPQVSGRTEGTDATSQTPIDSATTMPNTGGESYPASEMSANTQGQQFSLPDVQGIMDKDNTMAIDLEKVIEALS